MEGMSQPTRRSFLGGVAAGATLLALHPALVDAPAAPAGTATATEAVDDPRVAALIELSRDRRGAVHVERAAFVGAAGAAGTLPVSTEEVADLRAALASRDFTSLQQRGLRFDGHKFVFIRDSEDGTVVHAVRRGEFVTVRQIADQLVIATSGDGMAHPRAVEAVYQYARRTTLVG